MTSRRSRARRALPLFLAAALLVGAHAPAARTATTALALVRVRVDSVAEAQLLLTRFDETHNHGDGWVELLLWPGDSRRLAALGFDYVVVTEDLAARDRARLARAPVRLVPLPGPDRSDYRALEDYVSEMRRLATDHPGLVRLIELPHASLEGRTIYGIEIAADVRASDGRPTFYLDGVHHAREWPAGEYSILFAHYLVENYGANDAITRLLERVRVVVVPVVNVDGFDYSRESPVSSSQSTRDASFGLAYVGLEGYWRKNRRSFTGVTVPGAERNPDAYGVDPNRNYAYLWGDDIGGSGGYEVEQTYRGARPFSEPETQNVRELILSRQVTGVVTNHTYGRLVLRPWGHTGTYAPDEKLMSGLGARMAAEMGGYDSIQGIGLYATTGTAEDWVYGATSALAYTFEHEGAFHPAYARSVGKTYDGVMDAFVIMAQAAADPANHATIRARVVDRAGNPIQAKVELLKSFETPLWDDNPWGRASIEESLSSAASTSADGMLDWHVNPSTRPHVLAAGRTEAYMLVFSAGDHRKVVEVVVRRGEKVDLGIVRLDEAR